MGKTKSTAAPAETRTPKVRIARPAKRPFQIRYRDPETASEIRLSVGSRSEADAKRLKSEIEAKLLLGLEAKTAKKVKGPSMAWSDFREEYSTLQLTSLGKKSAQDAESRLDIAERIVKPRQLRDMANGETLHRLQSELLSGAESRHCHRRSPFTVRSYMAAIMAAINWAAYQGWLKEVPKLRKVKVAKLKHMKGRPITTEEFERMLDKVESVTGQGAAASWEYTLRGLWESALRLNELLHVSWDISGTIQPVWKKGRLPVLQIPHTMQKNATEDSIPLLPGFESLLLETPAAERSGWVFRPMSLQGLRGRSAKTERLAVDWVKRILSRIGKAAGVVVEPENRHTGRAVKYASAHDLRRSCAERLLDARVPPLTIARVLRHESWETTRRHYAPGDVQKDAGLLRELLGQDDVYPLKSGYTWDLKSS